MIKKNIISGKNDLKLTKMVAKIKVYSYEYNKSIIEPYGKYGSEVSEWSGINISLIRKLNVREL